VQASAAGQATANSLLDGDPFGLGVGWMRQRVPFHRSASVRCTPELTTNCPTAVHVEPEGHETPLRALAAALGGSWVDWTVHLPPLRRSASVTPSPDFVTCKPTAVHTEVVGQETAGPSAAPNDPFPARGFGLAVTDHPDPDAAAVVLSTPSIRPPGLGGVAWAGPGNAATANATDAVMTRLTRISTVGGGTTDPAQRDHRPREMTAVIDPARRLIISVLLPARYGRGRAIASP